MRTSIYFATLLLSLFALVGCKTDSESSSTNEVNTAAKSEENKSALDIIRQELRSTSDQDKVNDLLKQGYEIAKKSSNHQQSISFLMPILRRISDKESRKDYLRDLVDLIEKTGRKIPTQVLARGYTETYPDDTETNTRIKKLISEPSKSTEDLLTEVAKSSMADISKGLVKKDAQAYVDGCEAYALVYPDAEETPDYLLKGGEMSGALKTYGKTLELYDWIINDYPESDKVPTVLFMKAFLLDNELRDYDNAKKAYADFLQKYPDHHFVGDVRFLMENMGKSDEELRALLENQK